VTVGVDQVKSSTRTEVKMALLTLPPTRLDEIIAREVSSHTDRSIERAAGALTWGAEEHVLLGLAAIGWLLTRNAPKAERRLGDHFMPAHWPPRLYRMS
jgi:hypothetical protein